MTGSRGGLEEVDPRVGGVGVTNDALDQSLHFHAVHRVVLTQKTRLLHRSSVPEVPADRSTLAFATGVMDARVHREVGAVFEDHAGCRLFSVPSVDTPQGLSSRSLTASSLCPLNEKSIKCPPSWGKPRVGLSISSSQNRHTMKVRSCEVGS